MISREIVFAAHEVLHLLSNKQESIAYLEDLARHQEPICERLLDFYNAASAQKELISADLDARINNASEVLMSISLRRFDLVFENVLKALSDFNLRLQQDKDESFTIYELFVIAIDNYWRQKNESNLNRVLSMAVRLNATLNTLRDVALNLLEKLAYSSQEPSQDESDLSIYLSARTDVAVFAEKLAALGKIYTEFCELLNVSEAEFPLKVLKIESGSFWADIQGNSAVIHFVLTAVTGGAAWIYKNYSRDGRLQQFPQTVEAINALLKLEEQMAARGMDVSQMQEKIQKVAVKAARSLEIVFKGEPEIEINGAVHPLTPENQRNQLMGGRILTIQDTQQDNLASFDVPPNQRTGPSS